MSDNAVLFFAGVGFLAIVVAKFSRTLHELAKTKHEERTLQALVAVWLSLTVIHCYGLYFAYSQLLPVSGKNASHSFAAVAFWLIVNLVWIGNIFVYYDYGQPNAARQPQLVEVARQVSLTAIVISCATLLIWPIMMVMPGIPLTLPSDITLAVGSTAILAFGVFYIDASRRARLAQKSKDGVS